MPPPTILAHKTDFLTSQTLQLSRPLWPSNVWRASNNTSNNNSDRGADESNVEENTAPPLSEKAIDDALYRLNHALQQHARRVYAPQATRHVAEQIEALYLEAGERALRGRDDDEEDTEDLDGVLAGEGRAAVIEGRRLRVGLDFTTDTSIASLPPTWDQHPNATAQQQAEAHPPEARRYADLTEQLTTLGARRREARERVARLRRMRDLLAPFSAGESGDAGADGNGNSNSNNVGQSREEEEDEGARALARLQPNLVTRNGEIEKELERMRVLLVRVAGRIARLPSDAANGKRRNRDMSVDEELDEDPEVLKKRKVEKLLDMF